MCDDLEGWNGGGGRLQREGIHVYTELIHVPVQQKLAQHCIAIILQLKKFTQSEVSQKEKHQYSVSMHINGFLKDGTDDPICETAKETPV